MAYDRQSKLFGADVYYISGRSKLKADKSEEAIKDLARSLDLRNMVNSDDPDRALPAISVSIAHTLSGREAEALAIIRNLLGEKSKAGETILKQLEAVSLGLCNNRELLDSDAGKKQQRSSWMSWRGSMATSME